MMVETFMAGAPAARNGGDRWMVGVHIDTEVLVDDDPDGMSEVEGGPALPVEAVRRLFCDASTVAFIRRPNGEALSVTRRSRTVPRPTRRAARYRDRGCRFPGCGERIFVDVHHIRHQARGGGHEVVNVIELCWFDHRLVHEGGWTIRFLEHDEVITVTPEGSVISSIVEPRAALGSTIAERNHAVGLATSARTVTPQWWNDPLHLGDIIASLQWHDERGDVT